jgi:hypothetical protein
MLNATDIFDIGSPAHSGLPFHLLARGVSIGYCTAKLEAQFSVSSICGTFYLLFTTDGTPEDDILSIRLLSPEYKSVDTVPLGFLGVMGSEGIFRNAQVVQPNKVEFSFFLAESDRWSLTVAADLLRPEMPTISGLVPRPVPALTTTPPKPSSFVEALPISQRLRDGLYGAIAGYRRRRQLEKFNLAMAPVQKQWQEQHSLWMQRPRVLHLLQVGGPGQVRSNPTAESDARKSSARGSL